MAHWWLLATLVISGVYLGFYLTRMWYPHDEGGLGQSAERVLGGEVPHRDFDEPYTGLLTYVHALAFRIGGVRLPVLRVPLYLATLLWLAAFFRISLRFVGPPAASAITLLALAWSVPNYPASMPSWYNLFFATFGVAALLRWTETRGWRWLFLAGFAGGISFLIKLSGLFYVAGAALYLLFATWLPAVPGASARAAGARRRVVAVAITLGLALFVVLLWRSVAPYYWPRVIIHFVLPGALLALALAIREWGTPADSASERLRRLLGAALPFTLGFALPVAAFGFGFAAAGGLPALLVGVFVAPFRRLQFASMRAPAPYWVLAAFPLAVLLRPRPDSGDRKWAWFAALAAVLLGLVLLLASTNSFPHRIVWQSVRSLVPILTALVAATIARPGLAAAWQAGSHNGVVALAMVTAMASLIQFPFSAPTYFLYVAPLILLTLVALVQGMRRTPRPLATVTGAFYAAFAVFLVTPGAVVGLGARYEAVHNTVRLQLPRAGLRVKPDEAELYSILIPTVQEVANGGPIWAGPDSPEVYFLSGFRNRSRAIFDFLNPANLDPATLLRNLQDEGVRAVVVNQTPSFSPRLPDDLLAELRVRFPRGMRIGRFELRWSR